MLQKGFRLQQRKIKCRRSNYSKFWTSSPSEWTQNGSSGRESLFIKSPKQFDISTVKGSVRLVRNEEEVQLIEELSKINQSNNYESQSWTKDHWMWYPVCVLISKHDCFFPKKLLLNPSDIHGG
jgi:hypothetical protein